MERKRRRRLKRDGILCARDETFRIANPSSSHLESDELLCVKSSEGDEESGRERGARKKGVG